MRENIVEDNTFRDDGNTVLSERTGKRKVMSLGEFLKRGNRPGHLSSKGGHLTLEDVRGIASRYYTALLHRVITSSYYSLLLMTLHFV